MNTENYLEKLDVHHLEIEWEDIRTFLESKDCKKYSGAEIESEEHFLTKYNTLNHLRTKHHVEPTATVQKPLKKEDPATVGKYLLEVFALRKS